MTDIGKIVAVRALRRELDLPDKYLLVPLEEDLPSLADATPFGFEGLQLQVDPTGTQRLVEGNFAAHPPFTVCCSKSQHHLTYDSAGFEDARSAETIAACEDVEVEDDVIGVAWAARSYGPVGTGKAINNLYMLQISV